MAFANQCMTFKTFFPQKICSQIAVGNIRLFSKTLDRKIIGQKDSDVVQKRGFSDKAAVDR